MASLALDAGDRFDRRGLVLDRRTRSQGCSAFTAEVSVGRIFGVTGGATILDFGAALHAELASAGLS